MIKSFVENLGLADDRLKNASRGSNLQPASPEQNSRTLAGEYAARSEHLKSYPAVLYLESTRGCPYKCAMCDVPARFGRKSIDIDPALVKKLEPYFQYLKILAIHGDGEPLLSRNIDSFIGIARDNDCFLHMNTTGFNLRPCLADRLLMAKLHIMFSIHAGKPQTYQKIMGNDLGKVLDNIAYLISRSADCGADSNEFWFSYIVVKETLDEIDEFLQLAHNVGISKVRFMKLNPNRRITNTTTSSAGDFRYNYYDQYNSTVTDTFLRAFPSIEKRADALGIKIGVGSMQYAARNRTPSGEMLRSYQKRIVPDWDLFPLVKRKGTCLAPWAGQVQINQDGDVNLCCSAKYKLGNLYKQDFDEIWNGPRIRAVRAEFKNNRFPRLCGYCKGVPADEYGVALY